MRNLRYLIAFYVVVYAIVYLLFSYGPSRALGISGAIPDRMLSASISLLSILPVVLVLSWRLHRGRVLASIGLRRGGVLSGFVWANAFLLPIMLILLGMLLVEGPGPLLATSYVPLPSPVPLWYPLFAPLAWLTGGVAFFAFLQALPYESMGDVPKKFAIPLIAALAAGVYNDAFLTGTLRWDDILFFGVLFTVAYHESRNSIGIIAAYVLAESGVWYVVASAWGTTPFIVAIFVRTAISVVSASALIFTHYGRVKRPSSSPETSPP